MPIQVVGSRCIQSGKTIERGTSTHREAMAAAKEAGEKSSRGSVSVSMGVPRFEKKADFADGESVSRDRRKSAESEQGAE